ncbi:MAG TPA: hypothetical protein PLN24_04840, partial [Victivallales bacterium]|nr:hypothetical protein [Victivallales bacterium]
MKNLSSFPMRLSLRLGSCSDDCGWFSGSFREAPAAYPAQDAQAWKASRRIHAPPPTEPCRTSSSTCYPDPGR